MARIFWISAFSFATTGAGVPAGAITPKSEATSMPETPASAAVGTSGSMEMRSGIVTASARSFPALMSCREAGTVSHIVSTWPPTRSPIAGPLPL